MEQLFGHFEPFIREYGSGAVGIILFFESLGMPLPGESLLVSTGVLAARGELSLPVLLFSAWIGSVLGDNVGYAIGRRLGRQVLLKHGARIGLTSERFARIEAVFARYGAVTVAFARFVNVLRQLNGVVAGTAGMEWKRFLLFNALGAGLWVLVWGMGAYFFGSHLTDIGALARRIGPLGLAVIAGAIAVAAFLLVRRFRSGG